MAQMHLDFNDERCKSGGDVRFYSTHNILPFAIYSTKQKIENNVSFLEIH